MNIHRTIERLSLVILFLQISLSVGEAEQPNVILILADDLGYSDVGFNGCEDIPTPHLDALAASGVRFEQGYVSASVCAPSRAGLLTGRYQQRFGSGENPPEAGWPDNPRSPNAGVDPTEELLSELLKPAGYTSGVIGKWHMGLAEHLRPNAQGFDYYYGFLNGAHSYLRADKEWKENPAFWPMWRNNEQEAYDGYLTDTFTDEGVAFVERATDLSKKQPFFLYMSYNAVHAPWQAPDNVQDKVAHITDPKRRIYAGMLVSMDDGIGRIISSLKDRGAYEKTMVIFLSDNGAPHNSAASSDPLRGKKGDTYEGGTRVPFVISWPGKLESGKVYKHPVSALDIVPTITKLAGAVEAKKGFDGVDLMPYLTGANKGRPHPTMYFRRDDDYAIRVKDWKLAWNDGAPTGSRTAELFNLADDPNEQVDLIHSNPEQAEQLQNKFDKWDSRLPDNEWWGGPSNRKKAVGQ